MHIKDHQEEWHIGLTSNDVANNDLQLPEAQGIAGDA